MQGEKEENHMNSTVGISILGTDTKLSLHEMPENKRIWPFLCKKTGTKWLSASRGSCNYLIFISKGVALTTWAALHMLISFYRNLYPDPDSAGAEFVMSASKKPGFPRKMKE